MSGGKKALSWECFVFGLLITVLDLIVILFKCSQLTTQSWVTTQLLLILLYAVLKMVYAWCIYRNLQTAWLHFEQCVVGVEQFLVLYIIWRVLVQYQTAAYNLQRLTKSL